MEQNNKLHEGVTLYNQKKYSDALAFFLGLPTDSDADKIPQLTILNLHILSDFVMRNWNAMMMLFFILNRL